MRSTGNTFGIVITVLLLAAVLGFGVLIGLVVYGSSNRTVGVDARADVPATVTAAVQSASRGQAAQAVLPTAAPAIQPAIPQAVISAPVSLPIATPVPQAAAPVTSNASSCPSFQGEETVGTWTYQGNRPAFPPPASPCQVLMAHGDITNGNVCHYRIFEPGQQAGNLGSGSFVILRFTGPRDQIEARIQSIAADLASQNAAKGGCSRI